MRLFFLSLLAIGHNVLGQQECCDEYCYGKDIEKPQSRQYTTKTAYQLVKGKDYSKQYTVPDCKPVKIWMLSRHGTRLPNSKTIDKMHDLELLRDEIVKNYRERRSQPDRGALCPEDLYSIQTWKLNTNITKNYSEFLTAQGWNDMKFLAKTYQRIFPELLQNVYTSSAFLFRHTDTQRTEASFKAFVEGLFGQNAQDRINLPPIPKEDTLLKPYESCSLWKKQDEEKSAPGSEIDKFQNSRIMMDAIQNISMRLGFKFALERKQIELIWDMCRFEQAWHIDRISSWCAAFTPDEVSVLEYNEDLKYFYKSGHGNELNSRITCAAVQDMMKHLQSKSDPHAIAYFTHSATIQMFLTALGIAKDRDALRADNYYSMSRREWKTSQLGPFGANFVAVKYECPNDAKDTDKVLFFLNQHPVTLDWCKVGLCDWSDVIAKYDRFINADCSDLFCENNSGSKPPIPFMLLTLLLVYLRFF